MFLAKVLSFYLGGGRRKKERKGHGGNSSPIRLYAVKKKEECRSLLPFLSGGIEAFWIIIFLEAFVFWKEEE